MPRPLMQHGVGQLETLFASSKANLKVLKQLEHELQFRQVPRALALLEQVQAAIPAASTAPVATVAIPAKQPELWTQPPAVQSAIPLPPPTAQHPSSQPATPALAPAPRPPAAETPRPAPSMTADDACRLLKVSASSPWQEVEQARRNLVQLAHPDRVVDLALERRDQVRAEAKRVNAAYAVLSAVRAR